MNPSNAPPTVQGTPDSYGLVGNNATQNLPPISTELYFVMRQGQEDPLTCEEMDKFPGKPFEGCPWLQHTTLVVYSPDSLRHMKRNNLDPYRNVLTAHQIQRIDHYLEGNQRYSNVNVDAAYLQTAFRKWRDANAVDSPYSDVERGQANTDARFLLRMGDFFSNTCQLFRNFPHQPGQRIEREHAVATLSVMQRGSYILRRSSFDRIPTGSFSAMTVKDVDGVTTSPEAYRHILLYHENGVGYYHHSEFRPGKPAGPGGNPVAVEPRLVRGCGPFVCFMDSLIDCIRSLNETYGLRIHIVNYYRMSNHADLYGNVGDPSTYARR